VTYTPGDIVHDGWTGLVGVVVAGAQCAGHITVCLPTEPTATVGSVRASDLSFIGHGA
jgi:hypothetical protein